MQIRKKMRVNYSKAKDLFGFKYAFYKHTRLSVLEKIKNKKKIFREQFYSKAKIFRKNFFTKIENRQRSGGRVKRGMVYYSTQYINTSTKRTYRIYIASAGKDIACRFRERAVCIMYFEGRALFPRYTAKNGLRDARPS